MNGREDRGNPGSVRAIDVSAPLADGLPPWPGDEAFRRIVTSSHDAGDGLEVSHVVTSLHAGTHVDAPVHVDPAGTPVDRLDPLLFLGPCRVVRPAPGPGGLVRPGDLAGALDTPRLLLATGTCPDPDRRFSRDFATLAPETVAALAAAGVRLVGIDTPSVDPFDSTDLPAHRALARHGIVAIEGLRLAGVPAGRWDLVALPLRVAGADAAPARVLLLPPGTLRLP